MIQEFLLYALLAYAPLAFGTVEPWSRSLFEAAAFVLAAFCLRQPQPDGAPVRRILLPTVMGLAVLCWFQSLNPAASGMPASLRPSCASAYACACAALVWAAFAALLWAVPCVLNSPERARRFTKVMFSLGVLLACIGLLQAGMGNKAVYGLRPIPILMGPFGPIYNKDHAAVMLAMALWLGVGFFLEGLGSLRKRRSVGDSADLVAKQLMLLCLLCILGAALWKVRSRGVFLACAGSGALTGLFATRFFRRRTSSLALLALLGLTAAAGALQLRALPRYRGRAEETGRTMIPFRLEVYRQSLEVAQDHPLFGVGGGGIRSVFPAYQNPKLKGFVFNMHCDWLDLLLQYGPLGLLGYGAAILALFWSVLRRWQESERGRLRAGMMLAALMTFLLESVVDSCFQTTAAALWFFALFACLGSPGTWLEASVEGTSVPKAVRWLGAAAALLLSLAALRPLPAAAQLWLASTRPQESRPYFLTRALTWDRNPRTLYDLASAYVQLAARTPQGSEVLLRLALKAADEGLRLEPVNYDFLNMNAYLLQRLGRPEDAERLRVEMQKVYLIL